jgi:hypothetical protein
VAGIDLSASPLERARVSWPDVGLTAAVRRSGRAVRRSFTLGAWPAHSATCWAQSPRRDAWGCWLRWLRSPHAR